MDCAKSAKNTISVLNHAVGRSIVGRIFRLEGSGHEKAIPNSYFLTEVRAGITTFFTMAYIISVNALVLTDSGGTCVCTDAKDPTCASDPNYNACLNAVNRDLITATSAISCLASVMFGLFTNLPVAFAPGMGLNAYFAYQVVGYHGTGPVPYRLALAAVFIEGFIFVFLALIGMRQWLVKLLPTSIKIASAVGIGLFLAEIGLSGSAGIGAISGDTTNPVTIAGCPAEFIDATTGACTSHQMRSISMWIGILCGGILTAFLMCYRVKSAIIIGILVVSIISWPRSTSFTYFPHTPEGDDLFDFFKNVVTFHPIQNTLNAIDWNIGAAPGQFALALFTFLYVDIIDCTGTLYSMARYAGVVDKETGDFPRSTIAYCTDAFSISIGALFGTSSVTAFIESGAGIAEGGKTGLTAVTTGLCFFISIFFAPIFASIPPWATGCTLILVGCMMMRQVVSINWKYIGDAVPAFVTLLFIPFSYSIAYGVIAGLMTYIILNGLTYLVKLVTRGHIVPDDYDNKEYWTYKPSGELPWFIRGLSGPREIFRPTEKSYVNKHTSPPDSSGSLSSFDRQLIPESMQKPEPVVIQHYKY
ncbi:xanthine/uracil permease family protein-like protein [Rhizodiscina lignyota]|uniref:Xanthine/uracil permease family protein-like protein n=1 Tax=Rhizodiscina lignyota TaxID=1504668 RepID=A0A9P4IDP3_9PEZI|nr:xanthine/uracil permease family protein-like protein [Rhizodiscina lignyota]